MGATGRILPLVGGIVAAVAITGVAALAMSGPPEEFEPPIVEAAVDDVDASLPATPAPNVEDEATKPVVAEVDHDKVARAHDSFPQVSKEARAATEAKQAERVAVKRAQQEAEEAKKAAAAEKQRQEAQKEAAAKRAAEQEKNKEATKQSEAAQKDEAAKQHAKKKDEKADEPKDDPAKPAWWPEHHWAHVATCTVSEDGQTVQGTWDLWLKHGGDWAYVAASPSPAEVSGTDGDKLKLVYPDRTASFHKEHGGKVKYRGETISVTVANAADASETRTFKVDLWAVAGTDGSCPA